MMDGPSDDRWCACRSASVRHQHFGDVMVLDEPGLPAVEMKPSNLSRVPNKPKTPQRTFRIPDDVYARAKAKAEERGETVTDAVVRALKRYGSR